MRDMINSMKQIIEMEKLAGVGEIVTEGLGSKDEGRVTMDEMSLVEIEKKIKKCRKCELAKTRTNTVPGEGDPNARLMFIGEAPGADEDAQGRPFIGRAGQLLTKIIESIGLKREDVFIANILKCRPPGNRNPLPTEMAACASYLKAQIEAVRPEVICALGKFAAQTLLNTETPISKLRGEFYEYQGVKFMPTYHPAYLLRNQSGKKDVWDDMKKIAKELGIKVPKK
ncbi:MAG: uracil-DNA glycosylase [Candidatus Omnitrophota bacterium]